MRGLPSRPSERPRWGRGWPRAGGALTHPTAPRRRAAGGRKRLRPGGEERHSAAGTRGSSAPPSPPTNSFGHSCSRRTFASGAAASRIYKARGRCQPGRGSRRRLPAPGFALPGDRPMGGGVQRPAMVVSPGALLRLAG